MNRDKKNIDKLFEQGLKGYKETPPVYAWDRLDADLGKAGRRKTFFYLRLLAASVLILFAFGAGYFYAMHNLNSGSSGQLSETGNTGQPVNLTTRSEPVDVKDDKIMEIAVSGQKQKTVSDKSSNTPDIAIAEADLPGNSVTTNLINNMVSAGNSNSGETESIRISEIKIRTVSSIPVINGEAVLITISDTRQSTKESKDYVFEAEPLKEYGFNDKSSKPDLFRWTVGAQVAPINSYRDISTTYSPGSIVNEQKYNNAEESMTSIAAGVDVNYSVSKRFSFQTGMYYSKIGQVNNDALTYVEDDGKFLLYSIETSLGDIDFRLESVPADIREVVDAKDTIDIIDQLNVKVVEDFDIFEVPLLLRYKVLNKRFSINMMGGISPAFVTKNNAYLEVDAQKYDVENPENINSVYFNSTLSLGLEYSFLKKLSVNFEPTFKYALSPINNGGKFDYHPYSISWFTGIKYKF